MSLKTLAPVAILAVFIAVVLLIPESETDTTPAGTASAASNIAASVEELKTGDMAKLVIHDTSFNPMDAPFTQGDGDQMTMADFAGKVVVINFWATWCPPCRAEMPSIDRLAGEVAGDDIAVIAVSTDKGDIGKIKKFFDEIDVQNLAIYRDKNSTLARQAGAAGLPVTLILDRQGREVGRVIGEAEWDSREAVAVVRRIAEVTK
ncbi:MAG: TlpA disulfide reductase family protein [Pseudomonadota bacterium]